MPFQPAPAAGPHPRRPLHQPILGTIALTVAALALPASPTRAQDRPQADPADVESQDAIIAAVYDVISGGAGVERDWNRFISLFAPGARLIPMNIGQDGTARPVVITPEEYAERAGPALMRDGFFEVETHRVTEEWGHIAHMFSTYESRRSPDDAEPFDRGINSFQLAWDGSRWWVVTIFWDREAPGQPIPARYGG
jgi:hypothetical protein